MVTKKQHYYPRCLLKHFANEQDKVHVYINQSNKKCEMSYSKVCAKNNSYESDEVIDNILESKLGDYESQMGSIIDYILENIMSDELYISEEQQVFIFKYMYLQYIRTDSGRIKYIDMIENINSYKPRTRPIELEEINNNREKIIKFNWLFKQKGVLEGLLEKIDKPPTMNFHIAISKENLLTSDNPIIGTDEWKQMVLPISPYLCIEFQEDSMNVSKNLLVMLAPEKTRYLNEATINTANYYVISNEPFNILQTHYIYNRFKNENWDFRYPHMQSN